MTTTTTSPTTLLDAELIRRQRVALGLSEREVAKRLGVTGQVVPPALLRVSAETINGRRAEVVSDELGCFALDVPSRELIRLHLTTRSASAVTEWIRLDPHAR